MEMERVPHDARSCITGGALCLVLSKIVWSSDSEGIWSRYMLNMVSDKNTAII
jgi:hypothetical protein